MSRLHKLMLVITIVATIVFVSFMVFMAMNGLWAQFLSLVSSTTLMWVGVINSDVFESKKK